MVHAKPRYELIIDKAMPKGIAHSLASEIEDGKEVFVWNHHKLDVLRHVNLRKVDVRISFDRTREMVRLKGVTR